MPDLSTDGLMALARREVVLQLLHSYLHEQRAVISQLAVSVSNLRDANRHRRVTKHFGTEMQEIAGQIDRLHALNRSMERGMSLRVPLDQPLEPAQDVLQSVEFTVFDHVHHGRIRLDVKIGERAGGVPIPSSAYQAVLTLVVNALKATQTGGRVCLQAEMRDDALEISVTDSGLGVPARLSEAIWAPAFTAGSGTGFGLFFCREWAKAVGASVSLDHSYVGGIRFVVRFPHL